MQALGSHLVARGFGSNVFIWWTVHVFFYPLLFLIAFLRTLSSLCTSRRGMLYKLEGRWELLQIITGHVAVAHPQNAERNSAKQGQEGQRRSKAQEERSCTIVGLVLEGTLLKLRIWYFGISTCYYRPSSHSRQGFCSCFQVLPRPAGLNSRLHEDRFPLTHFLQWISGK